MGLLKKISRKANGARLIKLPSGSFTMDHEGRIIVSTLPQTFPEAQMRDIGERVLAFFRGAEHAQLPLQELNVYYPTLKLTARILRSGAIIFLTPQSLPRN